MKRAEYKITTPRYMNFTTKAVIDYNQRSAEIEYDDQLNVEDLDLMIENSDPYADACRELTSNDVNRALHTLMRNEEPSGKRTFSSTSTIIPKRVCACCRLLQTNSSFRTQLPLARRGRPHVSSRSSQFFCSNCAALKRQHESDIFRTTIKFDCPSTDRLARNHGQMLVWKINRSSGDTGSFTVNEKKVLLNETIEKLQLILKNRSTIIPDHDLEWTSRTLQTTINILSSSHNSI